MQQNTQPVVGLFRQTLQQANNVLKQRFLEGHSAVELVTRHAAVIDAILRQAWQRFFPGDTGTIALIAVGGYGRGELHPHSDIDLLILLDKNRPPLQEPISRFLTFLWDIGLAIGHSVRTLKECVREAKRDITITTNLQEGRLLIGPATLFEQQRQRCGPNKLWSSRKFFKAKWHEQVKRHQKFNDSAYNLEPNIKEGPGGLRDIQMIGWVAKRQFDANTLHDLVTHQFLTEQECQSLYEGQALLWQIRYGLHLLANRREDRLLFDYQRSLAQQFGYQDDTHSRGVEKFMQQYYRTVMELSRLNEMLLQLFQEEILFKHNPGRPTAINSRFHARRGFLEVTQPSVFKKYPFALLEVFLVMAQHPKLKGVRANTIRLIREHRHLIDARFREDLRSRSLFIEILRQPHGVTHELRRMNRYGVLAAYLPVFGKIVGQMQHDLFHVYTVDEHTLTLIRNLRRFTVAKLAHEFPLCSEVMQKIPKQELVLIAGMFHDIAKGRGGDHSKLGEIDAMEFCQHHGLSEYDSKLVGWLVLNHLLMSTTAQRKDINDLDVVLEFARAVGDQNRLNYIYLLTVADIRATSPQVWNSWKDALLRELYFATTRAFRRGLETPLLNSETIAENKAVALKFLTANAISAAMTDTVWSRFDAEYFLRYSPDEIAWHTQAIIKLSKQGLPLVLIRQETQRGGNEIFIYTHDHHNLFAHTTSTLEQLGLTIADARILTTADGYTLDSYIALDESGKAVHDSQRLHELHKALVARLHDPQRPVSHSNRQIPRTLKAFKFATDVQFWEDTKHDCTAMQVIAYDRPGLLSRIARALLQCQVRLRNAKIATYGERAEDIFYITTVDESPLTQASQFECLQHTIRHYLDQE
ncbi:MAG: [protein-PII] uridylyltransferase [Gammaproteobacteria bacterium]|nr:[protein-PII] uridylyltransferase [Gammaproteobacteria bacterium]